MDKEYLVGLLINMTSKYKVNIDAEMLGKIVNMSAFRIVEKGAVIQHIGDKTLNAALVLDGMTRCYYIYEDGNDMTRGFSIEGTLCMDEGMFGYTESLCEWETLEETTLMIFSTEDMKKIIFENDSLKNVYIYIFLKMPFGIKYTGKTVFWWKPRPKDTFISKNYIPKYAARLHSAT